MSKFRLIYLAPLLALIALSAWALASPIGASPDDDFHLASIWCADEDKTFACEAGDVAGERIIPEAIFDIAECYQHNPSVSAACQASVPSVDPAPTEETTRGNFIATYPPVFYGTMSIFVGSDIQFSILLMRFVNVALFVALTSITFALLPVTRRPTLLLAWIVTTLPLGVFLFASNNPSSWAVMGVGTLWIALLGYFETEGKRKIGLGVVTAVGTLMAAGARGDAAVYAGVGIAVALALASTPTKRFFLSAILPFALVVIAFLFFLSSRQVASGIGGFGGGDPIEVRQQLDPMQLTISNFLEIPALYAGVFGGEYGLGWLDTILPAMVTFAGGASFLMVTFVGLSQMSLRKGLVAAGLVVIVWLLPVYVLTQGLHPVGEQVQPRYLMPLLVLLAGVLLLGVAGRMLLLSTSQLVVIVAILSFAHFVALHGNMRRYIAGVGNAGFNLDNGIEWWWDFPFSPMAVLVVGALAYAGLLVTVVHEISTERYAEVSSDAKWREPATTSR